MRPRPIRGRSRSPGRSPNASRFCSSLKWSKSATEKICPHTPCTDAPAIHEGELKLELLFRASPEGQPVAKVTVPDDCEMLISIAGDEEVERLGPQLLVTQVERVLGVEL